MKEEVVSWIVLCDERVNPLGLSCNLFLGTATASRSKVVLASNDQAMAS